MKSLAARFAAAAVIFACSAPGSRAASVDSPVSAGSSAAPLASAAIPVYSVLSMPLMTPAPLLAPASFAPVPLAAAAVPAPGKAEAAAAVASPAEAPALAAAVQRNPAASAAPLDPSQAADPAAASAETARLWDGVGASPDFVSLVHDRVTSSFPEAVLSRLLSAGYRVDVNARVRENRPELDANKDWVSGHHAHGPDEKRIVIGETVLTAGEKWEKSLTWENAVNYEFGLAINRTLGDAEAARVEATNAELAGWYRTYGISEAVDFREAWRRDFNAMPDELKREKDEDGLSNGFYYYLAPDKELTFHAARERTFAEGLDILLRGPRSTFNYDDFILHFPHVLAQIRREMEARLGWRIPEPPRPAKHGGAWDNPGLTSRQLAEMLISGAASPGFVEKVRALVARAFPPDVIRDLLRDGYHIDANDSVRQGREHLHVDNDTRGGFHNRGAEFKYIVVAERLRLIDSTEWVESNSWENAVIHEIGHALAYIHGEAESQRAAVSDPLQARWYRRKGLSESPKFREEWRRDFEAMPADMKEKEWVDPASGKTLANRFRYYVHPDVGGTYQRARQETYAEGFDVLLRGERSRFNHSVFTRYFPHALAEIRRELGARYPELFPTEP
jgi:hypothetical protein